MRALSILSIPLLMALGACGGPPAEIDGSVAYLNAMTGESCEPDPGTLVPPPAASEAQALKQSNAGGENSQGGAKSPTGIPGDNLDDEHSGKIDCLGDGDSGHGNDSEDCSPDDFPQPGCDGDGCCEESMVPRGPKETPEQEDDEEEEEQEEEEEEPVDEEDEDPEDEAPEDDA